MPSIYVLYVDDAVVGPCLELIRKVCEPDSRSKPHVSVRGPVRSDNRKNYRGRNERISEVKLIRPGSFFVNGEDGELKQNTVYIECNFRNLNKVYYKPEYYAPQAPHITLYDGNSRAFAQQLLTLLKTFHWGFIIQLPKRENPETGTKEYPTLTELELKRKRKQKHKGVKYDPYLSTLFYEITSRPLEYNFLRHLTDDQRLSLVRLLYEHIKHNSRFDSAKIENPPVDWAMVSEKNKMRPSSLGIAEPDLLEQRHGIKDSNQIVSRFDDQLRLFEVVQSRANAKPRYLRSRLGQFLTPPELAIDMVEYVKRFLPNPLPSIHFGDPSVGTGTFFGALIQAFPSNRIRSAYGIEIDPEIASMTETLWSEKGLKVIKGNFFRQKLPPKRNLILSNPPYVRHHYMQKNQKKELSDRVKSKLGIDVSRLSSLYLYFMLLCHEWMDDGAIAAWLVPSEFMEVNYGTAMRKYLTEKVSTILVHRFDPNQVQFDGVIVTSCVVVFRNKVPAANLNVQFTMGGSLLNPKRSTEVSISELNRINKWPVNMAASISKRTPSLRLRDLFVIRRGLATGANSFFILTREEAKQRKIPGVCLKPILPGPRKLTTQIVQSETDGYPSITQQLCLIDCNLPEVEIQRRFPKLWQYLKTADEHGIRQRYLVRNRHPWYKQERRLPPPFLCTYLGRNGKNSGPFRFIWNRSNATATNQYLMLYPSEKLMNLLRQRPDLYEVIFKLLQTTSMSTLQEGGRVYGGGLYKIEPNELGAIDAGAFMEIFSKL